MFSPCLWLWDSTQGIVAPAGRFASAGDAEDHLSSYTGLDLEWCRDVHLPSTDDFAKLTWDLGENVAVVVRDTSDEVAAYALLPHGWVPNGR